MLQPPHPFFLITKAVERSSSAHSGSLREPQSPHQNRRSAENNVLGFFHIPCYNVVVVFFWVVVVLGGGDFFFVLAMPYSTGFQIPAKKVYFFL